MSNYKWLGTYGSSMQVPLCKHLWGLSTISSLDPVKLPAYHFMPIELLSFLLSLELTLSSCFVIWGRNSKPNLTWDPQVWHIGKGLTWFHLHTIGFELVLVGDVVFSRFEHAQSSNMNKVIFKLCIFSSDQTLFAIGKCLLVG